jgi:DNA-binding HxlR family transcriptional regulator
MPDLLINNHVVYNPVDYVLQLIGGIWKTPVLWRLKNKTYRYSELEKDIPHISQKMLTKALKELEADGIISKIVFAEVPPRVEYSLTNMGKKLIPVIEALRNTGLAIMKEEGIDYEALIAQEKKAKSS